MDINENKKIIIDYLSGTFSMQLVGDENERVKTNAYVEAFRQFFKIDDCQIEESSYALNNFRYQYIFSDYIILRLVGPINEFGMRTCQLELKGEGCREYERLRPDLTWLDLLYFLLGFNTNFKRIDVTIDDYSGKEITIADFFHKVKNGYYTSCFRSEPKYHGMLDTGLTIDMGSRKSGIELCVYDKLKQQISLDNEVEYNYWCRYEMRFRGDKANSVILDLIKNYKNKDISIYGIDLKAYAIKTLYGIIDIKIDNNYNSDHQKNVDTDPKWLKFLENTEKGILPKANTRISTNESRFNYIMPKAKMIILQWLMECNFNSDLFLERILSEEIELLKQTTRGQLSRLNLYLKENDKPKLSFDDFNFLITKIDKMLDERSLPF